MKITENQLRNVVKRIMKERLEDYRQVLKSLHNTTQRALREEGLSDSMFAIDVLRTFESEMKMRGHKVYFATGTDSGMWRLSSYGPGDLRFGFYGWSPTSRPSGINLQMKIDDSMSDEQVHSEISKFLSNPVISQEEKKNPVISQEEKKMSSYAVGLADYVARTGNYD